MAIQRWPYMDAALMALAEEIARHRAATKTAIDIIGHARDTIRGLRQEIVDLERLVPRKAQRTRQRATRGR